MLIAQVMDTPIVEWLFANWMTVAIAGVAGLLAYRGGWFGKALAAAGGSGTTPTKTDNDEMGQHVVNLFAIRGLLSQAGNVEAVAAIDNTVLPGLGKAPDMIKEIAAKEEAATTKSKAA